MRLENEARWILKIRIRVYVATCTQRMTPEFQVVV